jgi:serine/threonine protein kinase
LSYCVNPWCSSRLNDDNSEACSGCQSSLLINHRFKLLRPLSPLGNDRRTEVFEVVDTTGSRNVPINTRRILKICNSSDEDVIRLFERESETLQLLDHPAIPRSYLDDFFVISLLHYPIVLHCLALDKFDGITLDERLQRDGPIQQVLAINWLGQMAEILDYIHSQGFFHRDIKLTNILLKTDGSIALIDFGTVRKLTDTYFARITYGAQHSLTRVESFGFSAPEQLIGRAVPQSDFYSLGQTFIILLTGKYFHELDVDPKTGRIQWELNVNSLDKPFIRFINDLTNPSVARRPKNTAELLSIIHDALPRKLKWYRLRTNKFVKFSGIVTLTLLSIALFKVWIQFDASQALSKGRDSTNAGRYQDANSQLRWSIRLAPSSAAYLDCAR